MIRRDCSPADRGWARGGRAGQHRCVADRKKGILQRIRDYFGGPGEQRGPRRLEVCESCGADSVVPVRWEELDEGWCLALRCGECGHWRALVVSDGEAQRYGDVLDAGVREIAATVERLDRERMDAQADAFATALERDLIDAADFKR
jgi:hypothetical protein